jgi:hypothetical protein
LDNLIREKIMKLSDIMRDIADLLDQQQSQGADLSQNSTQQRTTLVAAPEPELDDEPLMVPPLQQKHELLKKVAGVDNAYGNDDQPEQGDELGRMRKMAGIVVAGDENDIN